jgi:hypothetical protein
VDCCGQVKRNEFHCARCHATFATLALFDAHQIADYGQIVRPVIICREPAVMRVNRRGQLARQDGLELAQDGRGTWHTPAGLARRERSRWALATARSAEAHR